MSRPAAPEAAEAAGDATDAALEGLRGSIAALGRVVVAFSGGADSALLAAVARDVLGDRALAVTAVSPSLPESELAHCAELASTWGLRWQTVETAEMADPGYVANGPDRCAHCKDALMGALGPVAAQEQATVVLGVNLDDLGDHRPGQAAAAARGARFPLADAGFTKAMVRESSRRLSLETWDKPSGACLASRVPYGTPVDLPTLRSVATAEQGLRALGLRQVRVRHHGPVARIEVVSGDLAAVVARREEVVAAVRAAGYRFCALDLEGFVSGSLNRLLEPATVQA